MRIKPALVTGAATVIAMAAIGVVVIATEPSQAQAELIWLLWIGLFLMAWGFICTMLLLARQSMARALWVALPPSITAIGLLMALQRGVLGRRLLQTVILATLVLSSAIWYRLRRKDAHEKHP